MRLHERANWRDKIVRSYALFCRAPPPFVVAMRCQCRDWRISTQCPGLCLAVTAQSLTYTAPSSRSGFGAWLTIITGGQPLSPVPQQHAHPAHQHHHGRAGETCAEGE